MNQDSARARFDVSVRALAEFVFRQGDLRTGGGFVSPSRAREGIRGHQVVQSARPDSYQAEVPLEYWAQGPDLDLHLRGRIDGVMETPDGILLEEIKTTLRLQDMEPSWLHLCQIKLYGGMWLKLGRPGPIQLRLTYYHLESGQERSHDLSLSKEELEGCLQQALDTYLKWLKGYLDHCRHRDRQLERLAFPFSSRRKGQVAMMEAVEALHRQGGSLMIEAPTGIGKTIATLLPTLKAMAKGHIRQCLILTASGPGQLAFEDALQHLGQGNLPLNSLGLTAQEKTCLHQGGPCDPQLCQRRIGYYDRLPHARQEALEKNAHLNTESLRQLADQHDLCPHALGLDLAPWTDLIMGDYHYGFHPAASLDYLFGEEAPRKSAIALLVDEAHNLAERGRAMHSQQLDTHTWGVAMETMKAWDPVARNLLRALWKGWMALLQGKKPESHGRSTEPQWVQDELFHKPVTQQAMRHGDDDQPRDWIERRLDPNTLLLNDLPTSWTQLMATFLERSETFLSGQNRVEGASAWTQLYFECHRMLKQLKADGTHHRLILKREGSHCILHRFCVDPSADLLHSWSKARATLFFSATLSPEKYHRRLLGVPPSSRCLRLESPFETNQWQVLVHKGIETTYRRREATYKKVVESLQTMVQGQPGNYLVFFPSYDYLEAIHHLWLKADPAKSIITRLQTPDMTLEERQQFLKSFTSKPHGTQLGFAIMGGIFGEGIDLAGSRLIGVTVVGVGLPQIGLERDLIRDYFENLEGDGFDFAYTYPGFNRVMQAVGRLIRSPEDRGLALILDQRYGQESYRQLIPHHWPTCWLETGTQLEAATHAFWEQIESRDP